MQIDLTQSEIALLLDLVEHRYFLLSQRMEKEKDPKELNKLQELSDKLIVLKRG